MPSPESPILEFNPLGPSLVQPVQIVAADNAATEIFNRVTSTTDNRAHKIQVQNCGTNAIKYRLNGTCSAAEFHGVLAAGTAEDDGLGGILNLNLDRGITTISLFHGAAYRAAVLKM